MDNLQARTESRERFVEAIDKQLAKRAPDVDPAEAARAAELAGAEATIEHLLKPLFRGYAGLLRERGIPCDCSFSANAREGQPNFVRRYAWATFLIGGGDLPGVSDSYLRFENDGGGWQVVARPAINKHVQLGNMSREFLLVNDTLKAAVEAKLQLYLRIALADPAR